MDARHIHLLGREKHRKNLSVMEQSHRSFDIAPEGGDGGLK